ncbi:ATP-dependent nuclease [Salinisphaera japonica]|uniref:ATP-dependent OLD family endonuclease n=1 Tax=Salinisphaera japonica YTM-1 TaxID=1209778 RepID=A0A423PFQ6_9GAMM|nr:ATP-dependent endonuclease [Salinisphaera japonica]ROO24336.1 ATP-dependent OLD family endonuclease [Salinisphaera japonica YTM-1]
MLIEKIQVWGFRLLENVELHLEPTATVIVGRNNSGKTSLTDIFDRFAGEHGPKFRLEDFSAGTRGKFLEAKAHREAGSTPDEVLALLPTIAVTLTFKYDLTAGELGPLAPFVIDLDPDCSTAIARIEYAASSGSLTTLFDVQEAEDGGDAITHFYRGLRETLPQAYRTNVTAIDPGDPTNFLTLEGTSALSALIQCGFVGAQRTLDSNKPGDTAVIGRLLGTLFQTANSLTAAEADQALVANLKASVSKIEQTIQEDFDTMVKSLLPALSEFGFPSLNDAELRPETSLNVETLLSDHTKIFYSGQHGVHLPEGYNGLGTRNLIYLLLQLEAFHKAYRARSIRPGAHLVFIEEPEAHLHPQMQEVLISQLNAAIKALSAKYKDEPVWQVQFVISTHSPHVANAASFEAVRYFLSSPRGTAGSRRTKVKDFRQGSITIEKKDRDFLHQYMNLTRCDLYFADKAILVEGPTERILMPRIVRLVDKELASEKKLGRQYITAIEVGGAYAHIFYALLDFLELKSLIITDIDAVRFDSSKEKPRWVKCSCSEGERTSNAAIHNWFSIPKGQQISIEALHGKTAEEKLTRYRSLAYQVAEDGSSWCGRSFEDALILANPDLFGLPEEGDRAGHAWEMAQDLNKSDTALQFAIEKPDWSVPKYIKQGLVWLSEPPWSPEDPSPIVERVDEVPMDADVADASCSQAAVEDTSQRFDR